MSALPVLPVLVTSKGSLGWIGNYAVWEVIMSVSGMGMWALRRAEAGSGEFPFWTSELLVLSWDSTKGSLFALKTVFFFFY